MCGKPDGERITTHVKGMLDTFPVKFKKDETVATPTGEDLFGQKSSNDKKLEKDKAEACDKTYI